MGQGFGEEIYKCFIAALIVGAVVVLCVGSLIGWAVGKFL